MIDAEQPPFADVLGRARDGLAALPEEQRADGARVVELCEPLVGRLRNGAKLVAESTDRQARVELNRLAELLGRRHAKAIVFASIARAALADLGGEPARARESLAQADRLLTMQGL